MYILDTNVVSELMLPNPNRAVRAWASSQELTSLYLTSINEAEMRYGYEIKPLGKARERLGESVERVLQIGFANRILPFDSAAAGVYAKLAAARKAVGRPVKRFDDLIAAVALAHDMSIATRNTQDFENAGLRLVNPWNGAGCGPFGMKLFFRWAHLNRSPAVPGPDGVCELSLPGTRMAFAGDPRFGPLAIPLRRAWLASGRLCRRPSGGRMFEAAVLHLLRTDNSAGLAGHVKRRP